MKNYILKNFYKIMSYILMIISFWEVIFVVNGHIIALITLITSALSMMYYMKGNNIKNINQQ